MALTSSYGISPIFPFPNFLDHLTLEFAMSDPRFARLKTDPRFRRPKKQQSKVVVDDRFKEIFDDKRNKKGKGISLHTSPFFGDCF